MQDSELKYLLNLSCRVLVDKGKEVMFVRPKKLIRTSGTEALGYVDIRTLAEGMCRYDLNEEDVAWLQTTNEEFAEMGESQNMFGLRLMIWQRLAVIL